MLNHGAPATDTFDFEHNLLNYERLRTGQNVKLEACLPTKLQKTGSCFLPKTCFKVGHPVPVRTCLSFALISSFLLLLPSEQ